MRDKVKSIVLLSVFIIVAILIHRKRLMKSLLGKLHDNGNKSLQNGIEYDETLSRAGLLVRHIFVMLSVKWATFFLMMIIHI